MAVLGEGGGQTIQRRKLCEIIEARMSEIYSLIGEEVKRSGHAGMLPAGVVLTGGGARIAGAAELARDVLQMPVRVGAPQGVGGLMDQLVEPGLQHAHRPAAVGRAPRRRGADRRYATASPLSGGGRPRGGLDPGHLPRLIRPLGSAVEHRGPAVHAELGEPVDNFAARMWKKSTDAARRASLESVKPAASSGCPAAPAPRKEITPCRSGPTPRTSHSSRSSASVAAAATPSTG